MKQELPFTENNLRDMMMASAKVGKRGAGLPNRPIYKPRSYPKKTNNPDEVTTTALSMPHTQRRDLVLRLAEKNGVTVRDLVAASDLPVKKASHALSAQKGRGYLKIFGYAEGKCGNKINIYVLTDKGRELLERIGK